MRLSLVLVASCLTASSVSAQSALDRTVGPDDLGRPLEFHAFTPLDLGALSRAAHVPIGFETLPARGNAAAQGIVLTGKTVREAVTIMTARDGRYTSREDDGVLLFEPVEPIVASPLDAAAPAVHFDVTTGRDAFTFVAALLGAPRSTAIDFGDVKPFALEAPVGTIRMLLNAVVRAHGELVWVFDRAAARGAMFPYTLQFMSGAGGFGVGLSGRAPATPPDPSRFVEQSNSVPDVLDMVVGRRTAAYLQPLAGMYTSAIWSLSKVMRTPFGMEVAPVAPPAPSQPVNAMGRGLRDVLDMLVERDPRYQWRVIDGVIVIRPVAAWNDAADPLFALVPDVELSDVTMTEAVQAVLAALGGDSRAIIIDDSKRVSLSVLHGTALDLLNALVRSHGELMWTFEPAEPQQVKATGLTHQLTLYGSSVGRGFLVRTGPAVR
jgi:hypothetical protein